ncbi:hypothetical protein HAX54_010163, partial [Datura stramonium]|nr:hypothetical protein [Datura stramonium]
MEAVSHWHIGVQSVVPRHVDVRPCFLSSAVGICIVPWSRCVVPINVPHQGQCIHMLYPEHIRDQAVPRRQIEALGSMACW